jgi:hypothetical protein
MKNFNKLIKEALTPDFLQENMALSKELENHPDFDILVTTLEDSLGIEIERSLRSGTYNGREGHYLRTPDVGTWTENAKESITRALDKASAKAQDHTFEYSGISDYEVEPGERSWDASIEFFADKEEEEEMWTDPAGGTHYGDDDDPASDYMEESIDREFHSTKVTSGHPNWSNLSAEEIQDYIDANPDTLWGRSLSTAKMVRDQKQESVNEEEQQHLKMPFANNLPQGPKRIEWYGKHLVKMMTPYDKEGPEGLLNALLDNPEDFPENWRVAPEGEVDYIESVFDEIVAFANNYNELTESVNEGWFTKKPIKSTLEGSKILTKYGIKATWDEDGNWVFKSKDDEKRAREVLDESVNEGSASRFKFASDRNEDLVIHKMVDEYEEKIFDYLWNYAGYKNEYKDESVNEMDMNDPVLMGMRASKQSMDTDPTSTIDYDEALSLRQLKAELLDQHKQLFRDMEQEAEPEGGPIADRYGAELEALENRIYKIGKQLMDYDMNESVNEDDLDVNYSDADAGDESIEKESASGAYESKTFDFKKMIKEAITPDYLKK